MGLEHKMFGQGGSMTWKGKEKLILEWSFAVAGLIALFWCAWYFVADSIPAIISINMCPGWTISLPFAISRGWDILLAFVGTAACIMLFTNEQNEFDACDDIPAMLLALAYILIIGLGPGIIFGIATSWLFLGFILIEPAPDTTPISTGLKFGLILGIGSGLIFGIVTGFLVFTLTGGLAAIFGLTKKHILKPKRGRLITS